MEFVISKSNLVRELQTITGVVEKRATLPILANLLLAPYFQEAITRSQAAWRKVVAMAVQNGIPVPAFGSALAYYDGYRSERLPANLLQAQRDYFGAHTYQRTDRPADRHWHTRWTGDRGEEPSGD